MFLNRNMVNIKTKQTNKNNLFFKIILWLAAKSGSNAVFKQIYFKTKYLNK